MDLGKCHFISYIDYSWKCLITHFHHNDWTCLPHQSFHSSKFPHNYFHCSIDRFHNHPLHHFEYCLHNMNCPYRQSCPSLSFYHYPIPPRTFQHIDHPRWIAVFLFHASKCRYGLFLFLLLVPTTWSSPIPSPLPSLDPTSNWPIVPSIPPLSSSPVPIQPSIQCSHSHSLSVGHSP